MKHFQRKKEAIASFFRLIIGPTEAEGKAESLLFFVWNTVNSIKPITVIKSDLTDNRQVESQTKSGRFFQLTIIYRLSVTPEIARFGESQGVNAH